MLCYLLLIMRSYGGKGRHIKSESIRVRFVRDGRTPSTAPFSCENYVALGAAPKNDRSMRHKDTKPFNTAFNAATTSTHLCFPTYAVQNN